MVTNGIAQEAALAATGETPKTAAHEGALASRLIPANQPPDDLEQLLPEIQNLALKVGGIDKLADLVMTLRAMKT